MKDLSDFLEEHGGESGYNLDPERLSDRQKLLNRCKERCLYLITEAEKTESRLREKLRKSGKYSEDIIDEAMDFLKEYGYLDDQRYARQLIRQYEGRKSIREIEQKLYQRGVAQADIKAVLAEYREQENSHDAELLAVRKLIEKKCRNCNIEELDPDARRKLYASLLRKGFSYSLVTRALKLDEEF